MYQIFADQDSESCKIVNFARVPFLVFQSSIQHASESDSGECNVTWQEGDSSDEEDDVGDDDEDASSESGDGSSGGDGTSSSSSSSSTSSSDSGPGDDSEDEALQVAEGDADAVGGASGG